MEKKNRWISIGVFYAVSVLFMPFSHAQKPIRTGVYNFEPLVFTDERGEAQGLFVDILNQIAAKEGWKIEYVPGTWQDCLRRLEQGEIDLLGSIGYSDDRAKKFDFVSEPLFLDWGLVYVPNESTIETIFDLRGKTVGVLKGSIYTTKFRDILDQFGISCTLVEKDEYTQIFEAIQRKETDAGINANVSGIRMESHYAVQRTQIIFAPVKIGFAVKKNEHSNLRLTLGRHFAELKADPESVYYIRYNDWMGFYHKDAGPMKWFWGIMAMLAGLLLLFLLMAVWSFALRKQVAWRTKALETEIHERRRAEEELKEIEQRYALAERIAHFGHWKRNLVTNKAVWSDEMYRIIGEEPGQFDLSVENFLKAIHPDDLESVIQSLRLAKENGECLNFEYRVFRRDGSQRFVHSISEPRIGPDGHPVEIVGTVHDITDRKHAEMSLQQSVKEVGNRNAEISSLLKVSRAVLKNNDFEPTAKKIFDECIRLIGATAGYVALLSEDGSENDVLFLDSGGRPCDVSKDLPMPIRGLRADAYRTRKAVFDNDFHNSKWMVCMPKGHVRLDNVMFAPLVIDEKAVGLIGLSNKNGGFTEEDARVASGFGEIASIALQNSRNLELLEESEARYRSVVQTASDGIISINEKGEIIDWNRGAEKIFGYSQREAGDMGLSVLIPPRYFDAHNTALADAKTKGQLRNPFRIHELNGVRKNGTEVPIELTVAIWLRKGETFYTGVIRDITERRLSEQQLNQYKNHLEELVEKRTAELNIAKEKAEAANIAKSRFLSNMSHELRTPLNIIMGFSHLMQRDKSLMADNQEKLATIVKSGGHLLELINAVLEMSKIETGSVRLSEDAFSLPQILDLLESMYALRAREKGIDLRFETVTEIPRFVRADEQKFRQVLLNLLGNAIKFTSKGHITVRVGYSKKDSRLFVEVEDTGAGIASEEMRLLFQPFSQTESGRRNPEGTGLGLSISKNYVELMGGEITVESRPGKGSIFRFHIRAEKAENGKVTEKTQERRIIGLEPGQPTGRILVAEDNADNRTLICALLRTAGFGVSEAENGREAVELWKTVSPNLILMDMRMPVMDGYEAVKIIRNSGNSASEIPIIAVTAHAFEEDRKAVMEMGCDDFVRKPLNETELFQKIALCLGVKYIYEEIPVRGKPATIELKPADLTGLPEEWLAELRHEAMRGNSECLLELADEIRAGHPVIADGLADLVRTWQFKKIVDSIPT